MNDLALGAIVLVGDRNWRKASLWTSMMVFAFGRRDRLEHLDMRCTVAWWKAQPYLVGVREAQHPRDGGIVAARPTTPPPPKPKR